MSWIALQTFGGGKLMIQETILADILKRGWALVVGRRA
jgi:hypothetical protein